MATPRSEDETENTTVAIKLRGGVLAFGDKPVFENLDLDVPAGRITCLLGPSGAGKSSLLRMIAGLSPEAKAQILTAGDGSLIKGNIAYMDQRDLLLPWLNVLENVTLGARLRSERPDQQKAMTFLRKVGLQKEAKALPETLSGGMRQRVALARTLMEDRAIVLMDEPFSAMDALTRLRLQDLAAEVLVGHTVLLVTHDPLEALRLGHRILVLRGEPAQLAPALELGSQPPRSAEDPSLHNLAAVILRDLAGLPPI